MCKRVERMLVGQCSLQNEEEMFDLLLYANDAMFMSNEDSLGVSKSSFFEV